MSWKAAWERLLSRRAHSGWYRADDYLGWHPQGDGRWFYGFGCSADASRTSSSSGFARASGVDRSTAARGTTYGPAERAAGRNRSGTAPRGESAAAASRRHPSRRSASGVAPVDGLPGFANLRPGRHRKRANMAERRRPDPAGLGRSRPERRAALCAHDGMSERMRATLHGRDRHCRTERRTVSASTWAARRWARVWRNCSVTNSGWRKSQQCSACFRGVLAGRTPGERFGDWAARQGTARLRELCSAQDALLTVACVNAARQQTVAEGVGI